MKTFFRVGSRLINTTPGGITDVDLQYIDPKHPDVPGVSINWGTGNPRYSVILTGQDAQQFRSGCEAVLVMADLGALKSQAAGY